MKIPLFAFTADWHIARSAWKNSGIDGDSYFGLAQVVDYCVAHELPLVAAGDLFDTTDPSPEDVAVVRARLDRMQAAGLMVFYVQGQHERESTPWMRGIHAWPDHLDRGVWSFNGFPACGLDWRPATQLQGALAEIPSDVAIAVMHQVASPLMGSVVDCELDVLDVPHARLLLVGDCHRHTRLDLTRTDGTPLTVLSPGSLCMQSIDEEPEKKFYVVGRDDEGDLAVESVPLRSRLYFEYDVTTQDDVVTLVVDQFAVLDMLLPGEVVGLPEDLHKPLVRVRLAGDLQGARARIKAAAGGRYHLSFKQPPRSAVPPADAPDRALALANLRDRGVLGVLATLDVPGDLDPARVRADVAMLLGAKDKAAAIEELCRS